MWKAEADEKAERWHPDRDSANVASFEDGRREWQLRTASSHWNPEKRRFLLEPPEVEQSCP